MRQFPAFHLLLFASLVLLWHGCAGGVKKPPCGDGICEHGETWETCPADCIPPCGDGVAQGPEECDGQDLRGATCLSIGLGPGILTCASGCYYNITSCEPCTSDCAVTDPATCSGNNLVTCRQNKYTCWKWTESDCAETGQVCDEGTGVAACSDTCTSVCTEGQKRCMNGAAQECSLQENGCWQYETVERCDTLGRECLQGTCVCPEGMCEAGSTRCVDSTIQTCDASGTACGQWQDDTDCAETGWLCSAGSGTARCVPDCEDTCGPAGSSSCQDQSIVQCIMQSSGCLDLVPGENCAETDRQCHQGQCICVHQCNELQGQCSGTVRQSCTVDAHGCRRWVDGENCADTGRICDQGTCICHHQCSEGQMDCSSTTIRTCTEDAFGCRNWVNGENCADTQRFCSEGSCVCNNMCLDGQIQCSGNTTQSCIGNAFGCWGWVNQTDCATQGQVCSGGLCVCDHQCSEYSQQCNGNIAETCAQNMSGCWTWSSSTCSAPLEYCGAGACRGYIRTDFTGSYSNITGGTSLTTNADEGRYVINLPFTFTFYGVPYTTAYACTNGWLSFGANPGTNNYSNTGSLPASGAPNQVIYAFWDDLDINSWDCWSSANLRWQTLGSAPDRVVVVQWRDACYYGSWSTRANFQIRLYETSNIIEIMYNRSSFSTSGFSATTGMEDDARGLAMVFNGSISRAPTTDYRLTPY